MLDRCNFCNRELEQGELFYSRISKKVKICMKCIEDFEEEYYNEDYFEEADVVVVSQSEGNIETKLKDEFKMNKEPIIPSNIVKHLNKYVISQDYAKKVLSVAIYEHYIRLLNRNENLKKNNIFLLGPTGTGKTYVIKKAAEYINVPFIEYDCTTLTEAGYVGNDVEDILKRLLIEVGNNVKMAEKAIIYLDEADKLTAKQDGGKAISDVSVQQMLLKFIEGSTYSVDVGLGARYKVDTTDILFICGGACVGLEEILNKKSFDNNLIGFGSDAVSKKKDINYLNLYQNIKPEDLIKYGFIPEFIGRMSDICYTLPLTEESLVTILKKSRDSVILEYKRRLKLLGADLHFTEGALLQIAKKALAEKTGARGLKSIVNKIMLDIMFKVPENKNVEKCVITSNVVTNNKEPKYMYKQEIKKVQKARC